MSGTHAVILAFRVVPEQTRDLCHGTDSDDALDGQVGLIREAPGEVICADLVRRNQRLLDQELRPLV